MATAPQFAATPNAGTPVSITAANTATDGTGTVNLIFTAGMSGSFLPSLRVKPLGTNVATLLRVFRNNGSVPTTAANNALIDEVPIAASTVSQIDDMETYDVYLGLILAATERIYVTIGTEVAAGVKVTSINGGDF